MSCISIVCICRVEIRYVCTWYLCVILYSIVIPNNILIIPMPSVVRVCVNVVFIYYVFIKACIIFNVQFICTNMNVYLHVAHVYHNP